MHFKWRLILKPVIFEWNFCSPFYSLIIIWSYCGEGFRKFRSSRQIESEQKWDFVWIAPKNQLPTLHTRDHDHPANSLHQRRRNIFDRPFASRSLASFSSFHWGLAGLVAILQLFVLSDQVIRPGRWRLWWFVGSYVANFTEHPRFFYVADRTLCKLSENAKSSQVEMCFAELSVNAKLSCDFLGVFQVSLKI